RLRAVEHGERVFKRMEILAIIATPPWVAGINRSRPKVYLPTTVLSALLLWAVPLAIGAYYFGPVILDLFGDAGTILSVVLVLAAGHRGDRGVDTAVRGGASAAGQGDGQRHHHGGHGEQDAADHPPLTPGQPGPGSDRLAMAGRQRQAQSPVRANETGTNGSS